MSREKAGIKGAETQGLVSNLRARLVSWDDLCVFQPGWHNLKCYPSLRHLSTTKHTHTTLVLCSLHATVKPNSARFLISFTGTVQTGPTAAWEEQVKERNDQHIAQASRKQTVVASFGNRLEGSRGSGSIAQGGGMVSIAGATRLHVSAPSSSSSEPFGAAISTCCALLLLPQIALTIRGRCTLQPRPRT